MPKGGIKFKNWDAFKILIRPGRFRRRLEKHVGQATARNVKFLTKAIRKQIQRGGFAKNAALTAAIKGSSKPLVDYADLFKAITAKKLAWDHAFVGLLRTSGAYNVGLIVHEGADVPVTAKMRNLFWVLAIASQEVGTGAAPELTGRAAELFARFQSWRPLNPGTRIIRIPPRPFVLQAMEDPALRRQVERGWSDAVQLALKK